MKNAKFLVLFLIIFTSFALFAQEDPETPDSEVSDADPEVPDETPVAPEDNRGKMIGGAPAMSWEDGGQDFFVMFNSNVDDKIKLYDDKDENPQGDTCIDASSFTLDKFHVPEDAIIEKAYLVWMGAVDPEKLDQPTDNEVHLAFTQTADSNVKYEADIKAGEKGKKLTDAASFDFEGIRFKNGVSLGCSETSGGNPVAEFEVGFFTYRVEVTDFFQKIAEENSKAEHEEGSGEYYGTYTFSGLDCTEHDAYRCNTTMVSGWSLFILYRSKNIKPKKIYFYNGLSFVSGEVSTSKVSGFELPLYPTVRVTTMIAEGDPSLTKETLPDEGIFLHGQNAEGTYKFKNKCNDFASDGHIEVYNSVSSIVNWDPNAEGDDQIKCIQGGVEDKDVKYYYGMDVDTFLLNSEKDINLQDHLEKGNTEMAIQLSVNQDAIFTNFMVLSVDIKGANFDIPDEDEKYFCACPASENNAVKDYYCPYSNRSREFYYLVKIQNWGEDETGKVTITDELDQQLDYVKGTTEYATNCREITKDDETKKGETCDDWEVIPDKDGGKFPLSGKGFTFPNKEKMLKCEKKGDKKTCKDKILVRYKVRPKQGIAKNYVFSNIALIKDEKDQDSEPYKTNTSYPLKLKPGSCVPDSVCSSPTQEMCGGIKINSDKECGEAGLPDCPTGYVCESNKCRDNAELMCNDAAVELALGKNSPQSDNSIIISKDNGGQPLVVGQFTLQASNCADEKVFNFDAIGVHFNTKSDSNFRFSDFELIYDADGNGTYDEAFDSIINDVDSTQLNSGYVFFPLKKNAKKYLGKSLNYFIVRAKVDYKGDEIAANTSFFFYLEEGDVRVNFTDDGTTTATVSNEKLDFATFYLEPTGDFFIVTTGAHDPAVPAISEMNSNIPVMQIRTKSISKENSIKKFKVKNPNTSKFVRFGDKNGITGISLWLDTNDDGKGDIKLAEKTSFESGESTTVTFDTFSQPINYIAGEEKYFVVYVDFNMAKADPPMVGKIQIPKGGLNLGEESNFYELPLNSKTYTYACQEGDANCETKKKSGGCAVLEVESDNTNIIVIAAVLSAAAMLAMALLRKRMN